MSTRREGWSAQHRKHFDEIYEISSNAIRECQAFFTSVEIDFSHSPSVALALLFRRALINFESTTLLASHGFMSEARAQQRSMIEAILRLAALAEDPSSYVDLLAQRALDTKTVAGDLLSTRHASSLATDAKPTERDLKELIEKSAKRIVEFKKQTGYEPKKLDTYRWAQRGKLTKYYQGRYARLSLAVHHSLDDMSTHLVKDANQQIIAIDIGPEQSDPSSLLLDGVQSLGIAAEKYSKARSAQIPHALSLALQRAVDKLEKDFGGIRVTL